MKAPYDWAPEYLSFVADAPARNLPPPVLTRIEHRAGGGEQVWRMHLTSPRGASIAGVLVPRARVRSALLNGKGPIAGPAKSRSANSAWSTDEWLFRGWVSMDRSGADVEITARGAEPLPVIVWDVSPGLPAITGGPLLKARGPDQTPVHSGDQTIVTHRMLLGSE